ncbi:type II secretion system protein GspC [Thioflexithrix psekupsensis]|uniref:Type II secretion system protein GspC n=1 Tax=Thioflexithrix psekupsensis TaxID=1570016 RepID=A0A251XA02_9GAMM|nr:type II secretion system protein GspC [Thioflexithrix psekupsensis]OUD15045.1 type II secretion system protein GspC [Thioflexithrix psekupsensis]
MKWNDFLLRGIRGFIHLSLAALLGYYTVQWVLLLRMPLESSLTPTIPPQSVQWQAALIREPLNISPILEANWFGKTAAVETAQPAPVLTDLPDTRLNFKLYGIYYATQARNARAIIDVGQGVSQRYRIGDALPQGVVLHDIQPRWVILQRQDRYETLRLIGTEGNKDNPILNQNYPVQANQTLANNNPAHYPSSAILPQESTPEQLLKQYQQQLVINPQSLIRLIQVAPAQENGQFLGYRLSPGQDRSLFEKFGLETGDIITAVNDIVLDSPLKGFKLLEQMATASQLNLQINRNGQIIALNFAMQ